MDVLDVREGRLDGYDIATPWESETLQAASGDQLRSPDGSLVEVVSIQATGRSETVHNLAVEGLHNYHVHTEQGQALLVHNAANTLKCGEGVDDVINETVAGRGHFTSQYTLDADSALDAGSKWLGPEYRELGQPGSGVYRSVAGDRQFRMDANSLLGNHAPGIPHVHLE